MKHILKYTHAPVNGQLSYNLKEFHMRLQDLYAQQYQTSYGCLWACADTTMIQEIIYEAQSKQALNPALVFVIGIGGSYLGTKAVYEALCKTVKITVPLTFIDTFDAVDLSLALASIQKCAQQEQNVLVICVTKSGTTAETLVNFQIILNEVKMQYCDIWQELIVIISDSYSPITLWGHTHGCLTLSIPATIGGRFSVFTSVGLFPLAVAGIDIIQLCAGAQTYGERALATDTNTSMESALFVYEHYQKGIRIYDLFLFDKRLESVGKWYRQLLAESIGKERYDGTKVSIIPSVSIGTLELHSVAQLMLGAQPSMVTTFITVQHNENDIAIVHERDYFVQLKVPTTVHTLMNQAALATQKAYEMVGLSYDNIILPEVTPFYIGQLLQLYMMQVLYVAELTQVNPFDQPHVELYKTIMRQME